MLIYGGLLSPYVRKVGLAAAEKGIPWELVPTNPGSPDPDFQSASPFGKIPAMKDGDFSLSDSSAIIAYMEAKYPASPLQPADPQARGKVVWFDEFADTILCASGLKIVFNRLVAPKLLKIPCDEALAEQGEAELPRIYRYLESVAPAEGWLVSNGFSLADISVASILRTLEYVQVAPKPAEYPAIATWYDRVCARPAWQQIAVQEDAARRR